MKKKNIGHQFLIASTAFALLNILYLYFLTQGPVVEDKNFAISYEETTDIK
jgi:hypothetical protein